MFCQAFLATAHCTTVSQKNRVFSRHSFRKWLEVLKYFQHTRIDNLGCLLIISFEDVLSSLVPFWGKGKAINAPFHTRLHQLFQIGKFRYCRQIRFVDLEFEFVPEWQPILKSSTVFRNYKFRQFNTLFAWVRRKILRINSRFTVLRYSSPSLSPGN